MTPDKVGAFLAHVMYGVGPVRDRTRVSPARDRSRAAVGMYVHPQLQLSVNVDAHFSVRKCEKGFGS